MASLRRFRTFWWGYPAWSGRFRASFRGFSAVFGFFGRPSAFPPGFPNGLGSFPNGLGAFPFPAGWFPNGFAQVPKGFGMVPISCGNVPKRRNDVTKWFGNDGGRFCRASQRVWDRSQTVRDGSHLVWETPRLVHGRRFGRQSLCNWGLGRAGQKKGGPFRVALCFELTSLNSNRFRLLLPTPAIPVRPVVDRIFGRRNNISSFGKRPSAIERADRSPFVGAATL